MKRKRVFCTYRANGKNLSVAMAFIVIISILPRTMAGEHGRGGSIVLPSSDKPLSVIENPFRYSRYYYDAETGFCYLKARYYSPLSGAFTSRDTYDLPDRYGYCSGNPVTRTDPSGHLEVLTGGIREVVRITMHLPREAGLDIFERIQAQAVQDHRIIEQLAARHVEIGRQISIFSLLHEGYLDRMNYYANLIISLQASVQQHTIVMDAARVEQLEEQWSDEIANINERMDMIVRRIENLEIERANIEAFLERLEG